MNETKFKRIEKKYIISKQDFEDILSSVKENMNEDKFYKSEIYNIYFDTDNYDFIIKSIDQPGFKQKLRARAYEGYDYVFFEIKTKLLVGSEPKDEKNEENQGFKRRAEVSKKDYGKILKQKCNLTDVVNSQVSKEIEYFMKTFNLRPKILVHYYRTSFADEDGLRITFDENVKYRNRELEFKRRPTDKYLLNNNNIIMEIKAHGFLPFWLVKILNEKQIFPERFSKIGKAYINLRKEHNV